MRRKLFFLLFVASAIPLVGILLFLRVTMLDQQQELARNKLSSVVSGVIGFYDRNGTSVLNQVKALADDDDLIHTLLFTDEIGFIDQSALIKRTERQLNLLDLDYLAVIDPKGEVLAQGHDKAVFGFSVKSDPIVSEALNGQPVYSLAVRDIKGRDELMSLAASPVWFHNRAIGMVIGGKTIDESYLQDLQSLSGAELILLSEGEVRGSTIPGNLDKVPVETTANVFSSVQLGGTPYKFSSYALTNFTGDKVADLMIGVSTYDLKIVYDRISLIFIIFASSSFILAFILAWSFSYSITKPIASLAEASSRMATGDFEVEIKSKRNDEIGKLVNSFNTMAVDLKDYREKLVDSERMAAFTQMAQKVAHEIKNPLTPIQVSIQDLKRSYDSEEKDFPDILDRSCNTVLEEVSSLAKIVKEFSEFARFPSPQMQSEDLNELMQSFIGLYSADVESGRMIVDFTTQGLNVLVDRDHLKRAIQNIINNAFEASSELGKIEVKAYQEGEFAVIEVIDNGPGFSPMAKKNLFSPYFTTKADGSGLGLVIVKKIISDHDGTIDIDDSENGSSVKLKLRLTQR